MADPTLFAAPGGDSGIGKAIQSIDTGSYAVATDSPMITTGDGTANTLQLSARVQQLFSRGQDRVIVVDSGYDTLHALGEALSIQGEAFGAGRVTVDGSAPLRTTGPFQDLQVTSGADDALIDGSVSGTATLDLSGAGATATIDGTADAVLSGSNATLDAGSGTVSLFAPGATVVQTGNGAQTVFASGASATVSENGIGTQTIVYSPNAGGHLAVQGGAGTQWVWTGDAGATVQAATAGTPGASIDVAVQDGSTTGLLLGDESTLAINLGGTLSVTGVPATDGSPTGAPATAWLFASAGTTTVAGGMETLGAVLDGGDLSLAAGAGTQEVFGDRQHGGTLSVTGSTTTADAGPAAPVGRQIVVDASGTIDGGDTAQQIWTGSATDTVTSSDRAADRGGSIALFVQGGTSSYHGGVENAFLDDDGGVLDAFLGSGGGMVSIGVDMAAPAGSTTVIQGFDPALDTLTLRSLPAAAALAITTDGSDTTLSFGASHVLLAGGGFAGAPVPDASTGGTVVVFGRG